MERLPDWIERLNKYIEDRRHERFSWGANDCVTFALGAVTAQTGQNPIAKLVGWNSALGAAKVIKKHGGSLSEAADLILPQFGMVKSYNLNLACKGELVITELAEGAGEALAICLGNVIAIPGTEELAFLPITGICCWKFK